MSSELVMYLDLRILVETHEDGTITETLQQHVRVRKPDLDPLRGEVWVNEWRDVPKVNKS